MIVNNARHETAIVIRRDGETVFFVRLAAGKLACDRLTERTFREQWREAACPLPDTLERFLAHARDEGATQEVLRGLEKLKARARLVVASLF